MCVIDQIFATVLLLLCFTLHVANVVAADTTSPNCITAKDGCSTSKDGCGTSNDGCGTSSDGCGTSKNDCGTLAGQPREKIPLCNHPPLHGISVLDDFPTPEYFHHWFVQPAQPVLFKSVLKKTDYPAYNKWTDDYLRKMFGTSQVTMETNKKERRWDADVRRLTLGEFLDIYRDKDVYMVQNVKHKMKEDIAVPKCLLCGGPQQRLERHLVWFSGGDTRSVLHYDTYNNINCLLDGTKRVVFIDKKHKERVESSGFDQTKGASRVNVDDVDFKTYPQFRDIPWLNATMEKGDCLFIPTGWYHQVRSLGRRNLAVNLWWLHIPWFNTTDCVQATNTPRPKMLSSYPRAKLEERIRMYLFDPFSHLDEVDKESIFDKYFSPSDDNSSEPAPENEQQRIVQRLERMFELIDADSNGALSWSEIMTFNITKLLVHYRDMFPFDPADVHQEDQLLELDVMDELDVIMDENEPPLQNTVSDAMATHDEF